MVSRRSMSALTITFLVVVLATKVAEGQSPTPSCVSNIIACGSFLNSTKPPPSCCDPLKDAVANQLECLCNLYADPAIFKTFSINITQALLLPVSCGIPTDISACKALAPGSSVLSPPAVPARGNGVGRIASTGLSSLLLVILGASLMLW